MKQWHFLVIDGFAPRAGGGGGTKQNFIRGASNPFIYHLFLKRYLFHMTNGIPFTYI